MTTTLSNSSALDGERLELLVMKHVLKNYNAYLLHPLFPKQWSFSALMPANSIKEQKIFLGGT